MRVSGRYVQQGEIHGDHQATIGMLVHELGHHFGLPDLYDTDGTSSGVGIHSVMAGGSWASYGTNYAGSSPTHPDAWSKVKMGWVNPTVISSEQMSYLTLNAIPNQYNVVKVTTDNPYEYFLMENRQFNGYDRGLQKSVTGSGGIAVWHIDESMTTNADERHKLVDLLESNEGRLGYSQLDRKVSSNYNHYYYSGHETMVNSTSKPNTYQYNGAKSGVGAMVYNSGNAMGIYAFKDKTAPTAPSNLRTSAVAANSVSLQWTSSTDNVALWYYAIYRNGQYLAGTYNPTYVDKSVTPGSTYTYTIYAMDYSGNFSPASNTITVTPR